MHQPGVFSVSVQVELLTRESSPSQTGGRSSRVVPPRSPAQPFVTLARIVATSQSASESRIQDRILDRARRLGVDAVILGKVDVLESMEPSPRYESTVNPAGFGHQSSMWGRGDGGIPFIRIPGVTSKGLRIRGKRDCICPALRVSTSSQSGRVINLTAG